MTSAHEKSGVTPFGEVPSASTQRAIGPAGRYVLGDLLGRGGMADVYRADDLVLGREVAVKLLRDSAPNAIDRRRFLAEAKTLARLNHPNLVTILDAGTSGEHPYLVLEVVNGASLSATLRAAGGRLSPERVLTIGAQVAAALAHCHAVGVVHRDVKPGNILLGADDRALLTDFGISRLLDASTHHTVAGSTIGTASYLAPEQVYGAEITPAVDMFALGLVLLEACTGQREYTGTPVEAAVARLHRSPRIPAGIPLVLSSALTALTRTDPVMRPAAADVAAALGAGTAAEPMGSTALAQAAALGAGHATDHATDLTTAAHSLTGTVGEDVPSVPVGSPTQGSTMTSPTRPRRRRSRVALTGLSVAALAALALVLGTHDWSPSPAKPSTSPTARIKSGAAGATKKHEVTPAAKLHTSAGTSRGGPATAHAPHQRHRAGQHKATKHAAPRPKATGSAKVDKAPAHAAGRHASKRK